MLFLIIGLLPATIAGWFMLETLQWNTRVLTRTEQAAMGMVTGLTAWSYVVFILFEVAGLPLHAMGFVLSYALIIVPLALLWWLRTQTPAHARVPALAPQGRLSTPVIAILAALGLWTLLKIAALGMMLTLVPPYFDDSTDNWNLRGKAYYVSERIELVVAPNETPSGVSSYPPSVPTMKAWLAAMRGTWDEPLVNAVHAAWYLACLVLTYCALRRKMGVAWSLTGAYALASLPLFLFQGMNAYADVYLASHLLCAMILLMYAATSDDAGDARSFLRLAAFAVALVPFTKNEGLILYTPLLGLATLTALLWLWRRRVLTLGQIAAAAAICAGMVLLIAGPWTVFKWMHGLEFGNAKGIGGIQIQWQENVLFSIAVNTFFEGNWSLLFPFLLALLVLQWKTLLRPAASILLAFALTAYVLQFLLYLFTPLSTEALQQTGYARGLIHLMPVIVIIAMLLLYDFCERWRIDALK